MPGEKSKFVLVEKGKEITDDKGNFMVPSIQDLVNPDGSAFRMAVISKFRRNVDGTQTDKAKVLFMKPELVPATMKELESLINRVKDKPLSSYSKK
jgi:hypothetical protein